MTENNLDRRDHIDEDRRTPPPAYGRRATDNAQFCELYIKRTELPGIIRDAVRQALDEYQHTCVMCLSSEDIPHVRDLVHAVREIGDDNIKKGIVIIRDNHKFVNRCHGAATKVGWFVIICVMALLGTAGLLVTGMWRTSPPLP